MLYGIDHRLRALHVSDMGRGGSTASGKPSVRDQVKIASSMHLVARGRVQGSLLAGNRDEVTKARCQLMRLFRCPTPSASASYHS